jgi:hypothetical protein
VSEGRRTVGGVTDEPRLVTLGDDLARMVWGVLHRGDSGASEVEMEAALLAWKAEAAIRRNGCCWHGGSCRGPQEPPATA